jgi:hypothetical protein
MYQPALRPDQIHSLYLLKQKRRVAMTKLAREAVDAYLARFQDERAAESDPRLPPAQDRPS